LTFFESKGHKIFPSSPLTNSGDPSVILTTAGMQQFKPYYLDSKKADADFGARRAVSSQKCFRTTDIDEVGDATHNTFFEMLGNFAFGDYFKAEAIGFAFEFLTARLGFNPADLTVTVFEGDGEVPQDSQSRAIWKELGIPETQIKTCGREDNFWGPTGDKGPCGPTSEIYVHGVEIWNLVFNEFYCEGSRLEPLKKKGVDTGMGLERLSCVMQQAQSSYDTDIFEPLLNIIARHAKHADLPEELALRASRIVADHIRGATFLMAEGLTPSNVKAGYILRRILRRAIRFGHTLNIPHEVFDLLIKKTGTIYQSVYPELWANRAQIRETFEKEYQVFGKTLKKGMAMFEKSLAASDNKFFDGRQAFFLFATYGFPVELIEEMLKERGVRLDKEGFISALEAHREVSKSSPS